MTKSDFRNFPYSGNGTEQVDHFDMGSTWFSHKPGSGILDDVPFVTGAKWHQPRVGVTMKVRERLRASDGSHKDAAAQKLTSKMKQAKSAAELLGLLDGVVDGPVFNHFHASAAYHSLATWKIGLTPSEKASPVLPRLAARVQDMTLKSQLEPRGVANVLWSLGQRFAGLGAPKGLLMALVKSMSEKAAGMNAQDLSNSLWACVQLKGVVPEVLDMVQEIVPRISVRAKDMIPQHLSNTLWAAAQLKDSVPSVRKMVPSIVAQIPDKASGMIPQHLSNSMLAATRLKDDTPEVLQMVPALLVEIRRKKASFFARDFSDCLEAHILLQDSVPEAANCLAAAPGTKNDFLGFAAGRFSTLIESLNGKDLHLAVPVVVWACARVNLHHYELLASIVKRMESGGTVRALPDWGLCALLWSYDVLGPDAEFTNFKHKLNSERVRRGLSESDVSESRLGYFKWNQGRC